MLILITIESIDFYGGWMAVIKVELVSLLHSL